jgi:hypothetical protein
MYPIKFQSIGSRDFREIFRINTAEDTDQNISEFIFGINDGDMLIEEAGKFYKMNKKQRPKNLLNQKNKNQT